MSGKATSAAGRRRVLLAAGLALAAAAPAAAGQAGSTPRPAIARASGPAAAAADDGRLDAIERAALDGVNAERRAAGLPPLVLTPELCRLARIYSRDMAERRYFDHTDPEGRKVDARADGAGIRWRNVGENIARNRGFKDPARIAVREWMKSEGHRENILDTRYRETGIGVWVGPDKTVYFTQIFLNPPTK
jgi:uncharacterized protein YkwD